MPNPWSALPTANPYVHPQDVNDLSLHFDSLPRDKRHHTEMLPNPFAGDPAEAKVLLLTKFPLYNPQNLEDYAEVAGYQEACRNSLTFGKPHCPFFFLNPAFQATAGYQWWEPKLNRLVQDCGYEAVTRKVMSVAYFPYHVEKFRKPVKPIYTQGYTFEVVRQARNQEKLILGSPHETDDKARLAPVHSSSETSDG